jgi:hypothetical protein
MRTWIKRALARALRRRPSPIRDTGDVIGYTTDMDGGIW